MTPESIRKRKIATTMAKQMLVYPGGLRILRAGLLHCETMTTSWVLRDEVILMDTYGVEVTRMPLLKAVDILYKGIFNTQERT